MKPNLEENLFDRVATNVLRDLTRYSSSRRGFLTRLSKLALLALGIKMVPLLPLDRAIPIANAQHEPCTDWHLCGIFGRPCTWCGSHQNYCPTGTYDGSDNGYWVACCQGNTIAYKDCCKNVGTVVPCDPGTPCYNNTRQPAWCSSDPQKGKTYVCTFWDLTPGC
jgi:hypothetical protein